MNKENTFSKFTIFFVNFSKKKHAVEEFMYTDEEYEYNNIFMYNEVDISIVCHFQSFYFGHHVTNLYHCPLYTHNTFNFKYLFVFILFLYNIR